MKRLNDALLEKCLAVHELCFAACESVYVFDDMEQAHKGGFLLVI